MKFHPSCLFIYGHLLGLQLVFITIVGAQLCRFFFGAYTSSFENMTGCLGQENHSACIFWVSNLLLLLLIGPGFLEGRLEVA